jgi:hypothetical protein
MARGLFTLKQQLQGIKEKSWNNPVGTYAGLFNGTSQYLTVASSAALSLTADFTVEAWFYATTTTNALDQVFNFGNFTFMLYHAGTTWTVEVGNGSSNYFTLVGTASLNSWHHFAITRNTNTYTFWIDGISAATTTNSNAPATSGATLSIGRSQSNSTQWFTGYLSNFRIVKGTAVYTQNFAPPTAPLTAITNTSLLTLQNATIIDNSINTATITNGNSVVTGAAMPFTQLQTPAVDYLVVAGGGGGGSNVGGGGGGGGLLQGNIPVATGSPITVTVGSGGTAGTGGNAGGVGVNSVFGSISASGGGYGGGLVSPQIGGAGGSGGGAGGSGTGWGGSTAASAIGGQGVFGQGNTGAGSTGGSGSFYASGGSGAGTVGISGASTYAGGGGAGIASIISGTVTAYSGGGGGGGGNSNAFGVGGVGGGGRGSGPAANAGNAAAGSTNTGGGGGGGAAGGENGTSGGSGIVIVSYPDVYAAASSTTGSPTVSTSGSGSLLFSGSNAVTYTSSAVFTFGTGDFTVECWIFPTSSSASQGIVGLSDTGSAGSLVFYNNANKLRINSTGGGTSVTSTASLSLSTWTHIAFSRTSGSLKTFINGVLDNTSAFSDNFTKTACVIGKSYSTLNIEYFSGYVSNVRIVKGTGIYTGNFTPSTTPLTPITNTSLLLNSVSGAYLTDGSTNAFSPTLDGTPTWNQASPFATGLGYKNRVYTWTSSGSITF